MLHAQMRTVVNPCHLTQRGSILLWAMGFSVTLLLLVVGFLPFFHTVARVPAQSYRLAQALALAEAGIDHALYDVHSNPANFGSPSAGGWIDPGVADCDQVDEPTNNGLVYGLAITACRRFDAPLVTAGDGSGTRLGTYRVWVVNYGTPRCRIVSRGFVPDAINPSTRQTLTVDLEDQSPTFDWAAYGGDTMLTRGRAEIDSYNSENGAYNPATPSANGRIGTNADQLSPWGCPGHICILDSTAAVFGEAFVAVGGAVSYPSPWANPPTDTITQPKRTLPQIQLPNPAAYGPNLGEVIITGGTVVCQEKRQYTSLRVDGGEFVMREGCQLYIDHAGATLYGMGIDTNGAGKVTVDTGVVTPVKVFVKDGGFDFDGPNGLVNLTQKPKLFQIYSTGTGSHGQFAQGANFYGLVYVQEDPAGESTPIWGGDLNLYRGFSVTEYFGSFVAGGLLVVSDNGEGLTVRIHRDESAAAIPLSGGTQYTLATGTWMTR